jgi:signal transduction histidine kinase
VLFGSVRNRFEWPAVELGKTVVSTPADGLLVQADRMRLKQALGNLVDNALRYGAGEVRLEARPRDGRIELHVRDNGDGLPTEFLSRALSTASPASMLPALAAGAGLGFRS